MTHPKILWQPSQQDINDSNIETYLRWLRQNEALDFKDYDSLWHWSITEIETFWESLIRFFDVKLHSKTTKILSDAPMPHTRWFEGATLNYTEHVFSQKNEENPAIIYYQENGIRSEISWQELQQSVANVTHWLKNEEIQKGDCVAAYLPSIPEATIAMLATASIGAVWSSVSPDFGADSVVDRFEQLHPKILIASAHYTYNGKEFNKSEVITFIKEKVASIEKTILVATTLLNTETEVSWTEIQQKNIPNAAIPYEYVDFSHPIWVLFSSGTTGKPKAITHSQGGILLEHLKYLYFHNDLKHGERYFWFSTTGWMMWNFVQGALLLGGTIALYNGNPTYPSINRLWELVEDCKIAHFGTSAPYILACKKAAISPKNNYNLSSLRSVNSSGAPLPPEGFRWISENLGNNLWLVSMSGGTDLCTAFVGGVITEPVYEGEIQRQCLGAAVSAVNEDGQPVINEVGEMVITQPMPSMPVFFWNDTNMEKYKESYFEMYANIWRHGDWLTVTDRKTLIISGRSDATLNKNGIRIGTAEIYRVVDEIPEIADSLIVNIELKNGEHFMPLFVQLKENQKLTESIEKNIKNSLRNTYSPRHVPDKIIVIKEIPYTLSGKKMEMPVKKILMGVDLEKVANAGSMRNPTALLEIEEVRVDLKKNNVLL